MTKPPEYVQATQEDLDELLALAKPTFPAPQYELLRQVLATFVFVMQALQNAKTSLTRFRKRLFGASTESKHKLLQPGAHSDEKPAAAEGPGSAEASAPEGEVSPAAVTPPAKPEPKKGHGRNGAAKYGDAPVIALAVPDLKSGDPCPACPTGRVYDAPPKTVVKVVGQPPMRATIYQRQHLRCRLCDATFTAPLPEGTCAAKYDPSCASLLALLRYGSGLPFYRIEGLQASLHVPLPDATQWDLVVQAVPAPRAVFGELIRQAGQGDLLHCDDTRAKILSLIVARNQLEAAGLAPEAKAINTSGIVAVLAQGQHVALYFTGHPHAGQNLSDILAQRDPALAPPMQMSDALACNFVSEFATIIGKCLTHGRRQIVDVIAHFPQPCRYVIEILAKVYANDAHCREEKLSSEQRLLTHQTHSAPPLRELKDWINDQFTKRLVEPNSGLGKALNYLLKHWDGLTLFLRQAGAPLDNNLCERALKRAILHRKNSLFYKTPKGAEVSDIYMSLIHTCQLCRVNPFAYLQALHGHAQEVLAQAAWWLPWNYREQLANAE
ncbi:MAG: IS66 family transposase [Candidatus Accumulibacter sp.]|uniref:IS66 family transposase n=1 Tax=Candidatus Accumulibacter affinis TaxID=2954384 RepID=A0A935TFP4_9PROT|nr:IS66 family transposase [Candidatus Accumulibacter affinis]